jgi:hypothetical protein
MDNRAEHLQTLGLPLEATWDEVTQAYKDLMKVWHPDRFQNDDRLRLKAEGEAQRINHAMSELRKLGKTPPPKQQATPSPTPQPRPSAKTQRTQQSTHTRTHTSTTQSSTSHTQFAIAPLKLRQKPSTSLSRFIAASLVFYLAAIALTQDHHTPFQLSFGAVVAFASLDVAIRSFLILFITNPLVMVDREGVYFYRYGKLTWSELDRAWPILRARTLTLYVRVSPRYIQSRSLPIRLWLSLKSTLTSAHFRVPFNGLTGDAVQVLNAMRLQQLHDYVLVDDKKPKVSVWARLAHLACFLCATAVAARCLVIDEVTPLDYIPYMVIFAICRTVDVVVRLTSPRLTR